MLWRNDYYPFGMQMPGRKFAQATYRYGFNGQENSNEIGAGFTTAMYWEYDSRIGRRWNQDPVMKVWESPYLCFGGNPILYSDPLGDDADGDGGKGKKKKSSPTPKPVATPASKPLSSMPSRPGINQLDQNGSKIVIPITPVKRKEQEILINTGFGGSIMGPASHVISVVAIRRENYNSAIASNIAGGVFGAAGYMIDGDRGSFVGASLDGMAMSFGGIRAGKSSVFPEVFNVQSKTSTPANVETPLNFNTNNPLANAQQVSGQFKLEGGPPNGTLYRANNQGKVTSYITYDNAGLALKRVDVTGASHNGVPTPHVLDYGRNTLPNGTVRVNATNLGDPRPANNNEIPKTFFIK